MACDKHPNYRGLRTPRATDENGKVCEGCIAFYNENSVLGKKETRNRKPKAVPEAPVADAALSNESVDEVAPEAPTVQE